ncbi:MFS transporter, partial [Oenococcus oeni]
MDSKSSKINNFSFRFALLSISLVLTSAYALSPAIPQMIKSFPDQSVSSIELLVTVPAFSVMILVLLSSYISKKVGEKLTVCIGLVLVTVFGIFPFFTSSYMLTLVSRIFLGAGFGLINSFAVSLISEFYKGSQKESMMGFRSGFESLGQAIMTFVAGLFLAFGWKYTTLVYLIAIPIFLLFYYYIPSDKKSQNLKNDADKVKNNIKQKISLPVWGIAIFLFLIVIFYIGMTVRFPLIVTSYHLGNAEDASLTLSIMTFGGMLLGF